MSTFFDRLAKSRQERTAAHVLQLTARAAEQMATARPVVQEEFSPSLADLINRTTTPWSWWPRWPRRN